MLIQVFAWGNIQSINTVPHSMQPLVCSFIVHHSHVSLSAWWKAVTVHCAHRNTESGRKVPAKKLNFNTNSLIPVLNSVTFIEGNARVLRNSSVNQLHITNNASRSTFLTTSFLSSEILGPLIKVHTYSAFVFIGMEMY